MDKVIEIIEGLIQAQPIVIGINGLDCSGKTTFATTLHDKLNSRNVKCVLLHIDDYNNLEVQKLIYDAHEKGDFTEELFERYYKDSIHYGRAANAITESRKHFDVTIIEGVFLFKDSLAPLLDLKVFLPVDTLLAKARYEKRKQMVGDNRPTSVFDDIWLPAFERYVREAEPEKMSDFIFT